jgi:hypothetical protein
MLERLVGYLSGVGPEASYALICSNCNSHNGLISADAAPNEYKFTCIKCQCPNVWKDKRVFIDKKVQKKD